MASMEAAATGAREDKFFRRKITRIASNPPVDSTDTDEK